MLEHIKESLKHNKLKKILALILSVALWVYVMGAQNPVIDEACYVKVTLRDDSPESKAPSYNENTEARVVLSAQRSYFIDYNQKDIQAYIDITDYGEGHYDIPVHVEYPKGFDLVGVYPATVHVDIENVIDLPMEVQLIPSGTPKSGSIVNQFQYPEKVTIKGPKSKVYQVTNVAGYVVIAGESEGFALNVPLSPLDENGRTVNMVTVDPEAINVFVDIEHSITKNVPVTANLKIPDGREISKITTAPINVDIQGIRSVIDSIDSLSTVECVIPENQDTYTTDVKLDIPEKVNVNVENVTVTVELKPLTAATSQ